MITSVGLDVAWVLINFLWSAALLVATTWLWMAVREFRRLERQRDRFRRWDEERLRKQRLL